QRVVGVLDFGERSRVAETRFVLIGEPGRFRGSVSAPGVEGTGDLGDVLLAECPLGAVDHVAQLARIDKQDLPCPSTFPPSPARLSFAKNHTHTGIPVDRNSCVGKATRQLTRSASTRFARICPSPEVFELIDPFAITTPADPPGASLLRMCCIQA